MTINIDCTRLKMLFIDIKQRTEPCHLLVRFFCHSKYMWIHVPHVLPTICMDNSISVYWQLFIGVYCNQNYSYKQVHKTKIKHRLVQLMTGFVWQQQLN